MSSPKKSPPQNEAAEVEVTRARADRDGALAQLEAAKTEHEATKAELADAKAELETAENELTAAHDRVKLAEARAAALQSEVDGLRAQALVDEAPMGAVGSDLVMVVAPSFAETWLTGSSPKARGYVVDFQGPHAQVMIDRVKNFGRSSLADGTLRLQVPDKQSADAIAHEAKQWLTDGKRPGTVTVSPANGSELAVRDAVRGGPVGAFAGGFAMKAPVTARRVTFKGRPALLLVG